MGTIFLIFQMTPSAIIIHREHSMNEVRLALIGFGNVAQGFTKILEQYGDLYESRYGIRFLITAVADKSCGNILNPEGISPAALLAAMQTENCLNSLPGSHPDGDAMEIIQSSPADVVVEMSYTNLETGEPATGYIAEALSRKKHVVTTNKGPIALHYNRLQELAHSHNVELCAEGTVMSGTPVLRVGKKLLAAAGIQRIEGILNGTTNYILTQMAGGQSYAEALAEAQRMGVAEADPTGDVEGFDAAAKVAILSRLVLDCDLPFDSIERQGITGLTVDDLAKATAEGKVWKLIGGVQNTGQGVRGWVRPQCLSADHPLARVNGLTNAVLFTTELLGSVTITGPGAGREETGYAVLQDLFRIYNVG